MLRGELFATDMVRAYQEGRKFHTCRPIKVRASMIYDVYPDGSVLGGTELDNGIFADIGALAKYFDLSKHRPGDYIYCRETWSVLECEYCRAGIPSLGGHCECEYVYRTNYGTTEDDSFPPTMFKWRPSIHMPREAARLFFRVPKVEVMRLEDVTEEFAREDGFLPADLAPAHNPPDAFQVLSARQTFINFWCSTYGPDARWMWVYWTEPCSREEAIGNGLE